MVSWALLAAGGFAAAGVAFRVRPSWWATVSVVSVAASLAWIVSTFTPWWTAAIVINLAVVYAAWGPMVGPLSDE